MKCRYCGGEIGLEDISCPYCGKANEQAVQHVQDMSRFRRRFAETESRVLSKAKTYSQVVPRVLVILILVIACVVMAVISSNAYSMPGNARRRAAERDPSGTIAVLESYLNEDDYLSFASYIEYNEIRMYGNDFSEYSRLYWCAWYYREFVIRMEHIFLQKDRSAWERNDASFDIRYLCQSITSFRESYDTAEQQDDPRMEDIRKMRSNMLDMLGLMFGFENTEEFFVLTENRMAAAVEEVLLDE
ncbi:MAG: hypothetical protein J6P48_01400 [Oscillospiraceae bacterium]|nr:hypothetical protein [Oscillospiraceae bacterium]